MHLLSFRTHAARAAGLLLALVVALGGPAVLAAANAPTPSGRAQPAAPPDLHAEVEGLTNGQASLAGWTAGIGTPGPVVFPEDAFGWRSGWFPEVVVAPSPALVASPPKTRAIQTTTAPTTQTVWWKRYSGTNHVWMPTLGINKHVYLYPCSRTTSPDNLVYRWGCAGSNNTYLLGHAYGVFKALHNAYYNGKLQKGMPVVYADGQGRVRLYRVTTWKVVTPTDSAWAIASQSRPSMTLQTCVGPNGSLRLVVRLVVATR